MRPRPVHGEVTMKRLSVLLFQAGSLALFCFVFFVFFVVPSSAADWSHWRGPFQTGFSPETNLPAKWSPDGENLIWKAPYGCRSTPLVMNGHAYFINYVEEAGKPITIQER